MMWMFFKMMSSILRSIFYVIKSTPKQYSLLKKSLSTRYESEFLPCFFAASDLVDELWP